MRTPHAICTSCARLLACKVWQSDLTWKTQKTSRTALAHLSRDRPPVLYTHSTAPETFRFSAVNKQTTDDV